MVGPSNDALYIILLVSSLTGLTTRAQTVARDFPYLDSLQKNYQPCSQQTVSLPSASGSQSSSFYIRLSRSLTSNQTKNIPSLVEGSQNGSCLAPDGIKMQLTSMCGCDYTNNRQLFLNIINTATCPAYRKIQDSSSQLGICEDVLNSLGYCVTLVPYVYSNNTDNSTNRISLFEASTLRDTVSEIERHLKVFFDTVDRTIVGSYFRTREHKCACLDSYKKWLCATRLKSLYMHDEDTSSAINSTKCCETFNLPNMTINTTDVTVHRLRPCLGACHRVIQTCPYYLPSNFQNDLSRRRNNDTMEVIFGGYPAFDCPRMTTNQQTNTTCTPGLGTYAFPAGCECIGAAISLHVQKTFMYIVMCFSTWFLCNFHV